MVRSGLRRTVAGVIAGVAVAVGLYVAWYLFADYGTRNAVQVALGVVPVLLALTGLYGVYRGPRIATLLASLPLLVLGVAGFTLGIFYLPMGLGLLVSYLLVR